MGIFDLIRAGVRFPNFSQFDSVRSEQILFAALGQPALELHFRQNPLAIGAVGARKLTGQLADSSPCSGADFGQTGARGELHLIID